MPGLFRDLTATAARTAREFGSLLTACAGVAADAVAGAGAGAGAGGDRPFVQPEPGVLAGRQPPRHPRPVRQNLVDRFPAPADHHAGTAAIRGDQVHMVHALMAGANINATYDIFENDSLLMQAVRSQRPRGQIDVIDTLLHRRDAQDRRVDMFHVNDNSQNVFHVAAAHSNPRVASVLLSTLLHREHGHTLDELERALDTTDAQGRTPEQIARGFGQLGTAEMFSGFRGFLARERATGEMACLPSAFGPLGDRE